jgi:hypothetical protein
LSIFNLFFRTRFPIDENEEMVDCIDLKNENKMRSVFCPCFVTFNHIKAKGEEKIVGELMNAAFCSHLIALHVLRLPIKAKRMYCCTSYTF